MSLLSRLQVPRAELEWLAAVETEQRAIKQLPFVKAVTFQSGEVANACRVYAELCAEMRIETLCISDLKTCIFGTLKSLKIAPVRTAYSLP